MSSHYLVLADRAHLRILAVRSTPGQTTPGLIDVHAMDFPAGRGSYTSASTDQAGRFQNSFNPGAGAGTPAARTGMSIDERLPMQEERDRRLLADLAAAIHAFLVREPDATWDLAAAPGVHGALEAALPPDVRQRLHRSLAKDLVHQPTGVLRTHFEAAAPGAARAGPSGR